MPQATSFQSYGIFVQPDFVDSAFCAEARELLRTSAARQAPIYSAASGLKVEEGTRKTRLLEAPDALGSALAGKFEALGPALEAHFSLGLEGFQALQFLRYGVGDFFRRHRDSSPEEAAQDSMRARKVSLVLFLSSEGIEGDTYEGGALTFYGLLDKPGWPPGLGLPLVGREGTLIGFPSELAHEVAPVTRGERYSVVSWAF